MRGELKREIKGYYLWLTYQEIRENLLFKIKKANNIETKKIMIKLYWGEVVGNGTGKLYLHFSWQELYNNVQS